MKRQHVAHDPLLTPTEVAGLFRVHLKTVERWAADGKIEHIRTPGGHYRFRESIVNTALQRFAAQRREL